MRIALDYDGTYTADPFLWSRFIDMFSNGHEVWIVTMRRPEEIIDMEVPIIYTSRKAKKDFCSNLGIEFDIWIDDMPEFLFRDG